MAYELYYTSAPKGLKPGSCGYCTVAATAGIPSRLVEKLEAISGYPLLAPPDAGADAAPVSWAHWRVFADGQARSILSRVALAGLDYTRRPNKLAYHLALDAAEQPPAGPAWSLAQPGVMARVWSDPPRTLAAGKAIPTGDRPPRACVAWTEAGGDAGWAGVLAEAFLVDPTRAAYLIHRPRTPPLQLVEEAIALLPPRYRWQVTFNTCFTRPPADLACAWRCAAAGTKAAEEAGRHTGGGMVIDLTRGGRAPDGPAAAAARAGELLAVPHQVASRWPSRPRNSSHV